MKTIVFFILIGSLIGISVWFFLRETVPPTPAPGPVSIEVDWGREKRTEKILSSGERFGEITLTSALELTTVYPHAADVAERYFERMKLSFQGRGQLDGREMVIRCGVVVWPSVIPGEVLTITFPRIEEVSCHLFDALSGTKANVDVKLLETHVRNEISKLVLRFDDVQGIEAGTVDSSTRLWVRTDGLEFVPCKR